MRIWTVVLALAVVCLFAVNTQAKGNKNGGKPKQTIEDKFAKMDTNGDKLLSQDEYVAKATKSKKKAVSEADAIAAFAKLGGSKDKKLSLEGYKAGLKLLHPKGGKKNA